MEQTKVDYIIVGDGYAAIFMAYHLLFSNKSFVLFSEGKKSATQVSAGIINPVVLKKFTTFWKAQEQIDYLKNFLQQIKNYTGKDYFVNAPVLRIFHDEAEQNTWFKKSSSENLSAFLDQEFVAVNFLKNVYKSGKVLQSGRLKVTKFFQDAMELFSKNNQIVFEKFEYHLLDPENCMYKNYRFSKVIFCEGMSVKNNPYFRDLPVIANKGHHIKVRLTVPIDQYITVKKKHFLFHLEEDLYFYGGTYERDATDVGIDGRAVEQLKKGLQEIYPHAFDVDDIQTGFRPTVQDRRPLIGAHFLHKNLVVFNGLGARGILNGCYFSNLLLQYLEYGKELPDEVSLNRFC